MTGLDHRFYFMWDTCKTLNDTDAERCLELSSISFSSQWLEMLLEVWCASTRYLLLHREVIYSFSGCWTRSCCIKLHTRISSKTPKNTKIKWWSLFCKTAQYLYTAHAYLIVYLKSSLYNTHYKVNVKEVVVTLYCTFSCHYKKSLYMQIQNSWIWRANCIWSCNFLFLLFIYLFIYLITIYQLELP